VPHGDWIDLFPCPEGRDRLIRTTGTFDEDELWADCIGGLYEGFPNDKIERRGIIAWSLPWDITGWEMSEGFLRKWGWLLKGLPGPLDATNRWRMERGEEPFIYDDRTSHATVWPLCWPAISSPSAELDVKPLDSIIAPGMAHQSFWPIPVGLRIVGQSVLAEDLLAQFQVSSSLHKKAKDRWASDLQQIKRLILRGRTGLGASRSVTQHSNHEE
jgi:hypothetical protein